MDSQYIIRRVRHDDYEQHVKLLEQLTIVQPITRDLYEEILDARKSVIFVCVDTNSSKLVGSVTVLIEQKIIHSGGKVAHIEDVVVDEDYRSAGIGKLLVQHAVSFAKERCCYKVILDCKPELFIFYSKCGFESKNIQMSKYFQ